MRELRLVDIAPMIGKVLGHQDFSIHERLGDIEDWDSLNHLHIITVMARDLQLDLDPSDVHLTDTLGHMLEVLNGTRP